MEKRKLKDGPDGAHYILGFLMGSWRPEVQQELAHGIWKAELAGYTVTDALDDYLGNYVNEHEDFVTHVIDQMPVDLLEQPAE